MSDTGNKLRAKESKKDAVADRTGNKYRECWIHVFSTGINIKVASEVEIEIQIYRCKLIFFFRPQQHILSLTWVGRLRA